MPTSLGNVANPDPIAMMEPEINQWFAGAAAGSAADWATTGGSNPGRTDTARAPAGLDGDSLVRALYINGPASVTRHLLPEGLVSVGRGRESSVVLDDATVSESHAMIRVASHQMMLVDLGSATGTFLRGERLPCEEPRALSVGETFRIGRSALVVQALPVRGGHFDRLVTLEEVRQRFALLSSTSAAAPRVAVLRLRSARFTPAAVLATILGGLSQAPWDWTLSLGHDQVLFGIDLGAAGDVRREHATLQQMARRQLASWGARVELDSILVAPADIGGAEGERLHDLLFGDGPLILRRGTVIFRDPATLTLRRTLARVASVPVNVLILGETGTGKDVVASMIHEASIRATRPFVAINCANLPEPLLESELFGYERGAFTGALAPKPGLLESADGGTVFLDEVGDLPLTLQAKMLRVIESHEVLRLGALRARTVDIRFVAATNRDLSGATADGTFRRDLFYRLDGVSIKVPPLRDRPLDIEALARHFLGSACARFGIPAMRLSPAAVEALLLHAWPGNVRELRNVVERVALLGPHPIVEPEHLGLPLPVASFHSRSPASPIGARTAPAQSEKNVFPLADAGPRSRAMEHQQIAEALVECGGNQTRAAAFLGVSRSTLLRKMRLLGFPRPRDKRRGQ